MRSKGQLSFDVFFAVIFALIAVQHLIIISSQFGETGKQISIRAQERTIANNLAAIISSAAALSDTQTSFTIEYNVPKILDADKTGVKCDITITSDAITISYPTAANPETVETVEFVKPGLITITNQAGSTVDAAIPAKCEEKITISKT